MGSDLGGIRDKIALFDNGEVLESHGGRDRMAAAGKAMAKRAQPLALVGDALVNRVADEDGGQRLIGRRDLLGHNEDIGADAELLAGEQRADAAKAVNDLIRYHQDVIATA